MNDDFKNIVTIVEKPIVWYREIEIKKNKEYIFYIPNINAINTIEYHGKKDKKYFIIPGIFLDGFNINREVDFNIPVISFKNAWRDCKDKPIVLSDKQSITICFKRISKKILVFNSVNIGMKEENVIKVNRIEMN